MVQPQQGAVDLQGRERVRREGWKMLPPVAPVAPVAGRHMLSRPLSGLRQHGV